MLWTTVALVYGALILFPVFWMATMVVKPTDAMFARPTVCLFQPTLEHFDYVIRQGFHWSLLTSFLLCTVSTAARRDHRHARGLRVRALRDEGQG